LSIENAVSGFAKEKSSPVTKYFTPVTKYFTYPVDKGQKAVIIALLTIKYLIKSGGGNGPVKPGNLRV
jgi:hypothetical protein